MKRKKVSKFKKYWLKTERVPRFVIPMIFFIFTTTSLVTAFAIMPALTASKAVKEKTVFISLEDEDSAEQISDTKPVETPKGTSITTEVDSEKKASAKETSAEIEAATNPAPAKKIATKPQQTQNQQTQEQPKPVNNTITIDQNATDDTPTNIVNPTPDNGPTDVVDDDIKE